MKKGELFKEGFMSGLFGGSSPTTKTPPPTKTPDVTQGGTATINSQIGNPFGKSLKDQKNYYDLDGVSDVMPPVKKTQGSGHGVGDLFKWVVQGRGAGNVATPVGSHAPAKAKEAPKAKTKVMITGPKIPSTPSIGLGKKDK